MPAAVRLGDAESHACHTTSASPDVFVNSTGVCRVDYTVCCELSSPPHPTDGVIVEGSPNVFVNSKPVARVGDATRHSGCGAGVLEGGSPNVFVNGG